jgi:hypothetical protein
MPTTGIMPVVAYAPAARQALFELLQFLLTNVISQDRSKQSG